jgi:hypothetical protein
MGLFHIPKESEYPSCLIIPAKAERHTSRLEREERSGLSEASSMTKEEIW